MTAVKKIVVLGGGLAGWAAAAGLANSLRGAPVDIAVADALPLDDEPLAEYTLPSSLAFFAHLGLNEDDVMRETRAAVRLGTEFSDWPRKGERRARWFGRHGASIGFIPFHHYAVRRQQAGRPLDFDACSANAVAARMGRFARPVGGSMQAAAQLEYGLFMDRAACTALLRRYALQLGVQEHKGGLASVARHADGSLRSLTLTGDLTVAGDLFLDCSGHTARLIGAELGATSTDDAHVLPCNRLMSVRAEGIPQLSLRCAALPDAWLLDVPLAGGGCRLLLYSGDHLDDAGAKQRLHGSQGDDTAATIVVTPQARGPREQAWRHNCIALGAAAGMPEPLFVSELHWLQRDILRLLRLLPADTKDINVAQEYNAQSRQSFLDARDYVLINHAIADPGQKPFWREYGAAESFERRRRLFESSGRVIVQEAETFSPGEWAAAWLSADVWPEAFDPLLARMDDAQLDEHFAKLEAAIARDVAAMPVHPPSH